VSSLNDRALLELIADGAFYSGEDLGERLGVSRSAIWKGLKRLGELGLEVEAVVGRGYRLTPPLELLSADRIQASWGAASKIVTRLEILNEIDSTNRYLLTKSLTETTPIACLAERQTAGRGRRGRQWLSPFGRNLYLSLGWFFPGGVVGLEGVSLAVALAVVRALADVGVSGLGVKWPNDIYWQGKKMAGVLLELTGEAGGGCFVVVGVGINVQMPAAAGSQIDQPWTDVTSATLSQSVSRNRLAGGVLHHLVTTLQQFEQSGWSSFAGEWRQYDLVSGQAVEVRCFDETVHGTALGVDGVGALLVETDTGVRRMHAGDVSLRLAS